MAEHNGDNIYNNDNSYPYIQEEDDDDDHFQQNLNRSGKKGIKKKGLLRDECNQYC